MRRWPHTTTYLMQLPAWNTTRWGRLLACQQCLILMPTVPRPLMPTVPHTLHCENFLNRPKVGTESPQSPVPEHWHHNPQPATRNSQLAGRSPSPPH